MVERGIDVAQEHLPVVLIDPAPAMGQLHVASDVVLRSAVVGARVAHQLTYPELGILNPSSATPRSWTASATRSPSSPHTSTPPPPACSICSASLTPAAAGTPASCPAPAG